MPTLLELEIKYMSIGYQIGRRAYDGEGYQDLIEEGLKLGDEILKLDPDNILVKGVNI